MTTYVENRKAYFNYEIKEKIEAGIELLGFEVKAIKKGLANLTSCFCIIRGNEAYLVGMKISPYQPANTPKDYDPERSRRLLLSKKEIKKLDEVDNVKGLTLIPVSLYNKKGLVKVSLAIAKGKKTFDKRETIKKRDLDREIRREYKAR
jgi:SsrA-binding protein